MTANQEPLDLAKCMEIGQTCACYKVRKAARAITQLYDEALRPSGIRATQFSLLMATKVMGPVNVMKLAKATVMDRTTLSRNLKLLQKRGMVTIKPGEDQRLREIALTAQGEKALQQALPLWQEAQDRVAAGLGKEKTENLLNDLAALIYQVCKG